MMFPDYVILVLSLLMIFVSAISSSKEDVMEAFTGSNQDLFKNRKQIGAEAILSNAMMIMGALFFIMILWSNTFDRFFNI
ncbi:preprotein translocase subunit SecG [Acholeplasma equirhinis]|uniref:preprotein translocase subunit SecG n=1 Tax=Acholeplasma equirhinis TaxID=555393 RepID=UPI00197ACEEB|nr:preprotein translocase subunit SecG [Acholeplasma equirhinis]MBN3490059.1 preprotein translocase subunit SecG [Acholeplasma equirhinis]